MNLHIVPDSGIIDAFYDNLKEAGLLENNRIIVRSNASSLVYSKRDLPFAALYSTRFRILAGDTQQYDRVYIHQLSPLMYRWIAKNKFKELNWLIWGADLYNLPFVNLEVYEELTLKKFAHRIKPLKVYLYMIKVLLTNWSYRGNAYGKVNNILTWMKNEFDFAAKHLPALKAAHKFFFYENQNPYHALDRFASHPNAGKPVIIVGNSGFATNNHLDAIEVLRRKKIVANLVIPVSYGDRAYIRFLKNALRSYEFGEIEWLDHYLSFEEYVGLLGRGDALIMNTIRPQGYGNILMMMYMNKSVFINDKNISLPDLKDHGLPYRVLSELQQPLAENRADNKVAVTRLFSHERLIALYRELFGNVT